MSIKPGFKTKFIDNYGLIHAYPNEYSENGILFFVENVLKTKKDTLDKIFLIYRFNDLVIKHSVSFESIGEYSQNPWSPKDPASHDNVTAIVAFSYLYKLRYHMDLKILGKFYHPRDVIFYSYLKGNILAKLLMFIPSIAMILSCLRKYKVRNGIKFEAVDGKLLATIRYKCVKMPITKFICEYIMKKRYGENFEEKLYRIYFRNQEDHPNIEMFKKG